MRHELFSGRALVGPAVKLTALTIPRFGEGCGAPRGEKNGRKKDKRG